MLSGSTLFFPPLSNRGISAGLDSVLVYSWSNWSKASCIHNCSFLHFHNWKKGPEHAKKEKKTSTRRETPPDFYLKELVPHDSNPGWLSEPLLQRVRLSSYTVRVLAWKKNKKRCRIAKRNVSERKDQCHLCWVVPSASMWQHLLRTGGFTICHTAQLKIGPKWWISDKLCCVMIRTIHDHTHQCAQRHRGMCSDFQAE